MIKRIGARLKSGDWAGLIAVLVVIGGLAAFFVWAPSQDSRAIYTPVNYDGSQVTVLSSTGNEFRADVMQKTSGFITIHEAIGEAPGPLIGVSDLLAADGALQTVNIKTTKELEDGVAYFSLMIEDDGDGVFEPGVDRPISSTGEVIKVRFLGGK